MRIYPDSRWYLYTCLALAGPPKRFGLWIARKPSRDCSSSPRQRHSSPSYRCGSRKNIGEAHDQTRAHSRSILLLPDRTTNAKS